MMCLTVAGVGCNICIHTDMIHSEYILNVHYTLACAVVAAGMLLLHMVAGSGTASGIGEDYVDNWNWFVAAFSEGIGHSAFGSGLLT